MSTTTNLKEACKRSVLDTFDEIYTRAYQQGVREAAETFKDNYDQTNHELQVQIIRLEAELTMLGKKV